MRDIKKIIEAALFVAGKPLTLAELYNVLKETEGIKSLSKPQIRTLLKEMEKEYDEHGIKVVERSEGFFELTVKEDIRKHVDRLAPEKDLPRATLQTLSLIAFRSPVKQSYIIEIRGNRAYDHIKELQRRGFINVEPEGHTNKLTTTKKFFEYFGIRDQEQLIEMYKAEGIEIEDFEKKLKEDGKEDDAEIPHHNIQGEEMA